MHYDYARTVREYKSQIIQTPIPNANLQFKPPWHLRHRKYLMEPRGCVIGSRV